MNKFIFIFLFLFLVGSLKMISADQFGYDGKTNSGFGYDNAPASSSVTNNTIGIVNDSNCWMGLCNPPMSYFLNLSGTNANQNIDINIYNLTTTGEVRLFKLFFGYPDTSDWFLHENNQANPEIVSGAKPLIIKGGGTAFEQLIYTYNNGASDTQSIDTNNRLLFDPSNSQTLDYGNGFLYADSGTTFSVDWLNRNLISNTNIPSVDWNGRVLYSANGNQIMDWSLNKILINNVLDDGFSILQGQGDSRFTGKGVYGTSYQATLGDDSNLVAGTFTSSSVPYSVKLADEGLNIAGNFDNGVNFVYLLDGTNGILTDATIQGSSLVATDNVLSSKNVFANNGGSGQNGFLAQGSGTGASARGGFIRFINDASASRIGYIFINSNSQMVFKNTGQSSSTDSGKAWIRADNGDASFSSTTMTSSNTTGNANVVGNFTGNQIYGGMWFHNDTVPNITVIASSGVYYNLSALTGTQGQVGTHLNGFKKVSNYLLANMSGTYQIEGSFSVSGGVNDKYHLGVWIDGIEQNNLEQHFKIGTSGDIVDVSITGITLINSNQALYIRVQDETSGSNIDVYSANLNLWRLGT